MVAIKYTKVEGLSLKNNNTNEFLSNPDISHLIRSAKSVTDAPKNVNKKSDGFRAIQFSGKCSEYQNSSG